MTPFGSTETPDPDRDPDLVTVVPQGRFITALARLVYCNRSVELVTRMWFTPTVDRPAAGVRVDRWEVPPPEARR